MAITATLQESTRAGGGKDLLLLGAKNLPSWECQRSRASQALG